MKNNKLTHIVLFVFLLVCFVNPLFSEESSNKGLQKGDLSVSLGAGKTVLFHKQFETVAPYLLTANIEYAFLNSLEVGLEYTPLFFANKSNVDFNNASALKNHNFGGIQIGGLNVKYNVYNDYGVAAYFSGGIKYSVLDKNTYIDGQLHEIDGKGLNYNLGFGVRYYLGDEYGDVYPWYFDMGIFYSRFNQDVLNYKLESVVQPKTDPNWGSLSYNSLDVVIRFGYRFRLKK